MVVKMRQDFSIGAEKIAPGQSKTIELPLSVLSDHTPIKMPVHVMHGKKTGPVLFVSAAIHGDEILGVEIIRRLAQKIQISRVRGTLLLIPIVNSYGFIAGTRYLPDRRDLNRSFPGREKGSLASQLAHVFMNEIVKRSDAGIDLHTAAIHRENLPQIRANVEKEDVQSLAEVFGAPVILNADLRDGSLRQAAQEVGVPVLLYEAGEALRFDEFSVRIGVKGVMRVMQYMGMSGGRKLAALRSRPVISRASQWVRAPSGGLMRLLKGLGDVVEEGEILSIVSDPIGHLETMLTAPMKGIIVGRSNLPAVNQGDAIFHIAKAHNPARAGDRIETLEQELDADPIFDTEIV